MTTGYPDTHPEIRDDLVTISTATGEQQLLPRQTWEKAAVQRDEFRRVIAMIGAWRIESGTQDDRLDALLASVGETRDSSRAVLGVIEWARSARQPSAGADPAGHTTEP